MKPIIEITKPGIVVMVLLCGVLGFALGHQIYPEVSFSWLRFLSFLIGLGSISAGSLALNSAQEWKLDLMMPRTAGRPIPAGKVSVTTGYLVGIGLVVVGSLLLYIVQPITATLGILTVFLYNVLYTKFWKKRWAFAAVPGAIPGAMPVLIGYSVGTPKFWTTEGLYIFLIMFLWQMPHFWALAIRYRNDYAKAGFPVLPVHLGVERTLYHMGLYVLVYVGVALCSPLFVVSQWAYLVVVIPFSAMVLWQFSKYFKKDAEKFWLQFFLWVNASLLGFLVAPVIDKFALIYEQLFWRGF